MALHEDEHDPQPEVDAALPPSLPPTVIRESAAIDARVASLARETRLSARERTVLRLIALGYRYREIGCAMSISPRTVKMYATNLRKKVGGSSRWDLMRRVLTG